MGRIACRPFLDRRRFRDRLRRGPDLYSGALGAPFSVPLASKSEPRRHFGVSVFQVRFSLISGSGRGFPGGATFEVGRVTALLCFLTFAPESDDIVWELCCFPDSWISGAGEREISSGNLPLSEGTPSDPLTELSSGGGSPVGEEPHAKRAGGTVPDIIK